MNDHPRETYRAEIDGLRALAVSAVIINHFDKRLLPGGYLGVDIFFVISGYVITGSLLKSITTGFGDFLEAFYERRIKRLAPALILCVAATSILICLVNPAPQASLKTGIASLFGLSNLYLLRIATNYFAEPADFNAFTHTWSLGVEEQFYLLYPLVLWLLLRGRSRSSKAWAATGIGLLSLASLAGWVYVSVQAPTNAFYLMPTRFWELGIGGLVFLAGAQVSRSRVSGIWPSLSMLFLLAALVVPDAYSTQTTIAVVAFSALLIATTREGSAIHHALTRAPMLRLGAISYSVYLWHWSVLVLSRFTIGVNWWSLPVQLLVIWALASASYRLVEQPLRRSRWSNRGWRSVAYGGSALLVTGALCLALLTPAHAAVFLGKNQPVSEYPPDQTPGLCNMTPDQLTGNAYRPRPIVDRKFVDACTQGTVGKRKILLVGDSFAEFSARQVAAMADSLGYEFKLLTGYGCPFPFPFRMIRSAASSECPGIDEQLIWRGVIENLNPGDVLVVRLYLPKTQYLAYPLTGLPPVDAYDAALAALTNAVAAKSARLLVIGGNPTLTEQQVLSLTPQWFRLPLNGGLPADQNPETEYFHALEDHLQRTVPSGHVSYFFSVRPYLCDAANVCRMQENSTPLYFDKMHLTSYAQDLYVQDLRGLIATITASP